MAFSGVQRHTTSAKPVTGRDKNQSVAHHLDSVIFNLAHSKVHAQEAIHNAKKLRGALSKAPGVEKHMRPLRGK